MTRLIDVLLSYAYHGSTDHHRVKAELPKGSLMWVDSGAFTAYTKGRKITVSEYAAHLERTRGAWDYAFTLDVIGDHAATLRQTDQLLSLGLPVVPIFTYGTSLTEFRRLCKTFGYVGCGGMVPLSKNPKLLTRYLRTLTHIAEEYGAGVHALGVGGRKMVIQSRVWSSDASTVESSVSYGVIPVYSRKYQKIRFISTKDKADVFKYREILLAYGYPVQAILDNRGFPPGSSLEILRCNVAVFRDMWEDVRKVHSVPLPPRLPAPDSGLEATEGPRSVFAFSPYALSKLFMKDRHEELV